MALVAICQLVLLVAGLVVGGRLVALWWRTRQLPELLIGLGLSLVVVCLPFFGLSEVGRAAAGEIRLWALAVGLALFYVGQVSLLAFTWRAFRPHAGWAMALVAAVAVFQAIAVVGSYVVVSGIPADADTANAGRPWLVSMRLPGLVGYIWAIVESVRQYRMAGKRIELGLGDPIVANRFLLWALVSSCAFANNAVSTALQAVGMGPTSHPGSAALLAFAGVACGILLCLAFLPPARYLDWVSGRAAQAPA